MDETEVNVNVNVIGHSSRPLSLGLRVRVVKHGNAVLPKYQTEGSVGMDLCAAEHRVVYPGQVVLVSCGVSFEIPPGYEGQVRSRSGLAKKGITVHNSPGTIDQDYRGVVGALMHNSSEEVWTCIPGDRICQIVFCPIVKVTLEEVTSLSETVRGVGGFGSTGT